MALPKLELPPGDGQATQSKQGPSSADTQ
jgi:hypothetical protein